MIVSAFIVERKRPGRKFAEPDKEFSEAEIARIRREIAQEVFEEFFGRPAESTPTALELVELLAEKLKEK